MNAPAVFIMILITFLSHLSFGQKNEENKLNFSYKIISDSTNKNLIHITAFLTNKSDKDIILLTSRCNGLSGFVEVKNPNLTLPVQISCNAYIAKQDLIKSKDKLSFKFDLLKTADLKDFSIWFKFYEMKDDQELKHQFYQNVQEYQLKEIKLAGINIPN